MKKIGFWFAKALAYWISFTPFALLYLRSDFYYFMVYHLFRYRRKVVRDNLVNSFPEKSLDEIKNIEKRFYHNLCDLFVETCKLSQMRIEDIARHVHFTNPEMIQELYEKGRSVFSAIPHSGNWEWYGKLMCGLTDHEMVGIYKKAKNPFFDEFMKELRLKFVSDQMELAESAVVLRVLLRRNDRKNHVLIVADQSPRGVESDYWTNFLHRDTCWFYGLEKLAKRLDYAVVFVEMERTGRGQYSVTFKLICEDPKTTEEGFIMEQYVRCTERFILNHPDNWLWSHRRWKHKRPVNQS